MPKIPVLQNICENICIVKLLWLSWWLSESLAQLLTGPLACTIPGCSWQLMGAQQLMQHVTQYHRIPTKSTPHNHTTDNHLTNHHDISSQSNHLSNGNQLTYTGPPATSTTGSGNSVTEQNLNWPQLGQFEVVPHGGAAVNSTVCYSNETCCTKVDEDRVKEEEQSVDSYQEEEIIHNVEGTVFSLAEISAASSSSMAYEAVPLDHLPTLREPLSPSVTSDKSANGDGESLGSPGRRIVKYFTFKGTFQRDLLFSLFESAWATDQWDKIFSLLVKIWLSYSYKG